MSEPEEKKVPIEVSLIQEVIRKLRFLDNHYRSHDHKDYIVDDTQRLIQRLESKG